MREVSEAFFWGACLELKTAAARSTDRHRTGQQPATRPVHSVCSCLCLRQPNGWLLGLGAMDVHATLRDRLATLLDYAVPVRGWQPVSPCASGTVSACFEAPDSYEHLAPVTWFGTARLLVLCGTAQAVLMLLALAWDLAIVATARWYRSNRAERDEDAEEAHTQYITLDCLDVALSVTSCITFVVRAYRGPAYSDATVIAVYVVDWAIAGTVMIFYVVHWTQARSKFLYVWSRQPLLNMLTITSSSAAQIVQHGWLPFTFLRSLTMNSALRRIFKKWDLPELYEQYILTIADFLALVFTFAGMIFMLENLGTGCPDWCLSTVPRDSHTSSPCFPLSPPSVPLFP